MRAVSSTTMPKESQWYPSSRDRGTVTGSASSLEGFWWTFGTVRGTGEVAVVRSESAKRRRGTLLK